MPMDITTAPDNIKPFFAHGIVYTPEEMVAGSDYSVVTFPKPVLLTVSLNFYVYYPAGVWNVPLGLPNSDWLVQNGAIAAYPPNPVYLKPNRGGSQEGTIGPLMRQFYYRPDNGEPVNP